MRQRDRRVRSPGAATLLITVRYRHCVRSSRWQRKCARRHVAPWDRCRWAGCHTRAETYGSNLVLGGKNEARAIYDQLTVYVRRARLRAVVQDCLDAGYRRYRIVNREALVPITSIGIGLNNPQVAKSL